MVDLPLWELLEADLSKWYIVRMHDGVVLATISPESTIALRVVLLRPCGEVPLRVG